MLEANYERAIGLGIVEKLSGLGYKYHRRLLCLYNGVLAYFSKIPADAENGNMNFFALREMNMTPKLAIACRYIKAIKPADPSLKKKKNFVFVVEFRKAAFTTNTKKDLANPKSDQELRWIFAVKDEDCLDKWISLIEQVKTSETINGVDRSPSPSPLTRRQNALPAGENSNEKSPTEKRPPSPIKSIKPRQNSTLPSISPTKYRDDSDVRDSSPGKSSFATGDKSKKGRRVQIKEVQNVYSVAPEDLKFEERLMKKEEELRREREREEENRRKQEEEREQRRQEELARAKEELALEEKLKQEQAEKLRIAWEYKYNLLMDENLKALFSIEDRIRTGFQLLRFIGSFRTEAVNLCRNIIDDLSQGTERKFAAFEKTNFDKSSKATQRVFFFGGIIVRMTWAERESVDLGEDGYHYLYTDKVVKSYNHEFRAMDILNDVLYSLNKTHKDVVYRVPLAVRVDYKGFKCLVISTPPVEGDETLQLGPMMSTGTYRVNKNIDDDLNFVARELNLKEHTFVLDDNSTEVNVPLSVFTEIHKVVFSGFEDGNDRNPTSSEAKLSFADRRVHDCFYFMKTADIFPVDIDLETNNNPSFLKRLRPEFLLEYERPLSADALLNNTGDNSANENDDIEVAQAGIHLRTVIVPAFVKKLDALELILVDSASLTEALHCHGINIRYLGLICQQTNLPHVKEVCITEMISRTAKKILSKELSDIVLQNSEAENESLSTSKERSGFLGRTSKPSSRRDETGRKSIGRSFQKVVEIEQDIGDCVIEVLNLIFGKGKESTRFWSEIMTEQIMYDFDYDIKNFQKTEISLGGLLLAVLHHCNINLKWDSSIEELLDKVPNPFTKASYEGLKARSKVYSLHSLDVKSLSERYRQARASKEYDAAIKSCLLAMSIEKQMAVKGEGFEDPVLLGDMAEIYYENQQLDRAYEQAKEGLKYSRTLHIEAVKCFCVLMRVHMIRSEMEHTLKNFEQAIKHLNFHVGLYHPMHATVYIILGSYYAQKENFQDALFLYKASLVCCMRILGPNHPSTGEVYLDLGNLTLKMRQQEDALNYFEKAFYVFEASKGEDSIECASTSYMMATLLMSFGKIKEAMTSVQHAMRVYEKNEEDYVERIAECCLLVCNIGESKNDDKLTLEHANKIWNILNKIPTKNSMYYKSRILTLTLTALIHGLTTDKKNFLYIISDAIVDVLGQENKLDKLNGGGEDTTLQKAYLEIIFTKSQASKNIQNLIKDILKTLFQKLQEKDLKAFFRDYRRNLENLEDLQLKECLIDFEMLIFIHGIQYLNDAFKKF